MSNQNQTAVTGYIEKLPLLQIVQDEKVSGKFIQLYDAIHGSKIGEIIYHKEQFNFNKLIQETPDLQQCTKLSLYGTFLDLAVSGLSLEKGSKPLAYVMSRSIKVKREDGTEGYEKRAYLEVSPYGELLMRIRAGHIKHADNPVIVYDGDKIKVGLNAQGHKVVLEYETLIPRKENAKITGGFIRLERHGGAFENVWFDIADVIRLKNYSNKQNKGDANNDKSNALYRSNNGQIDSGFFEAKIVKHAFRAYPKVRTGEFTHMQTQEVEEPINYGLDEPDVQTPEVVKEEEAFGQTPEGETKTVTIEDESF